MRRTFGPSSLALVAVLACATVGCKVAQKPATRATTMASWGETGDATTRPEVVALRPVVVPGVAKRDPGGSDAASGASVEQMLQLDVYTISVPAGAVSGSDEFWKRVDEEEPVTPATHAVLDNNGIRVGTAALAGWPYFKDIIDQHPAATRVLNFYGVGAAKNQEIEVRKDVATETIFYLDGDGRLKGRTHENCQNFWALSFQAVPREPEVTHVLLTPLIRSQRKRLEVITHRLHEDDPPTREIAYVYPEYLFELGVDARVPAGKFLVVATSAKATGGSVGEAFLMGETLGQRMERVMLLVPRQVPVTVQAVMKK